jgi:hypothetical protein
VQQDSTRKPGGVTGRDGYIVMRALLFAIAAIDKLEEWQRPTSDQADMIDILLANYSRDTLKHEAEVVAFKMGVPVRFTDADETTH